jgi:hypothetical protein
MRRCREISEAILRAWNAENSFPRPQSSALAGAGVGKDLGEKGESRMKSKCECHFGLSTREKLAKERGGKLLEALQKFLPDFNRRWRDLFRCEECYKGSALRVRQSHDDPTKVAYSPKPEIAVDQHKQRRKTTLGRFLVRHCNLVLTEDIKQSIALIELYLAHDGEMGAADLGKVKLVWGRAITEAYVNEVGGHSCMTDTEHEHISAWFSLFPERIGLLVLNKKQARALVWTDDKGQLWIDRIYAGNFAVAGYYFSEWAKKHGAKFCYDTGRCAYGDEWIPPRELLEKAVVTLGPKAVDGRPVPYLDSWCYASKKGEFWTAYGAEQCIRLRRDYFFQNTDGYFIPCCYCGCGTGPNERAIISGDEDDGDAQWACEECYAERRTCCYQCGRGLDRDCDEILEVDGEDWCSRCAEHCQECREVFDSNLIVEDGLCAECWEQRQLEQEEEEEELCE